MTSPDFGVFAAVILTVDATDARDINDSLEMFESDYSERWIIESDCIEFYSLYFWKCNVCLV